MKKTYFVPMCFFAGFFLIIGLGSLACGILFERLSDLDIKSFESEYKNSSSARALYSEALELKKETVRKTGESIYLTVAVELILGSILLCWAFDRRRLLKSNQTKTDL